MLCWRRAAQAQTYPSKTITFVVTAAAGGVTDIVARAVGAAARREMGPAGRHREQGRRRAHRRRAAGGQRRARRPHADVRGGRHLRHQSQPLSKDKLPFDIEKDFIPITGLIRIHHSVMVAPKLAGEQRGRTDRAGEAEARRDHLRHRRHRLRPACQRRALRECGERQAQHRSTIAARRPRINDVMGGHTNMMMVSVSLALPVHREGKVKMLSIGSAQAAAAASRISDHRGIRQPAGLHRRHLVRAWRSPRGTPRPIVDKINADVRAVMAEPAFKQRFLERQFAETMDSSPEEFRDLHPRRDADLGQGDPRAEPRDRRTRLRRRRRDHAAAAQPIQRRGSTPPRRRATARSPAQVPSGTAARCTVNRQALKPTRPHMVLAISAAVAGPPTRG